SLLLRTPPLPTLFPYTTLFRSVTEFKSGASELTVTESLALPICNGILTDTRWLVPRSIPDWVYFLNPATSVLTSYGPGARNGRRSEEHTSELQSRFDLVCRLLL